MPDEGKNTATCVYLRRSDLAAWAAELQNDLLDFKEKEEKVVYDISFKHVGKFKAESIEQVMGVFRDAAHTPDLLRFENLNLEDQEKVRLLRKKLGEVRILLAMEKLFSKYEEGWVPMEYLPGSLSGLRRQANSSSSG
jgi:hypothetical protein